MTDKEKAIVMAYTGVAMLTGEKFSIFHKYIEDIMERPVFTHELASKLVCEQIKEKSRNEFLRLCKEERPTVEWEKVTEAHEDIGYDRGFRDGYAQAVEERTCEWVNDEEGRNHEQRY